MFRAWARCPSLKVGDSQDTRYRQYKFPEHLTLHLNFLPIKFRHIQRGTIGSYLTLCSSILGWPSSPPSVDDCTTSLRSCSQRVFKVSLVVVLITQKNDSGPNWTMLEYDSFCRFLPGSREKIAPTSLLLLSGMWHVVHIVRWVNW